MYSQLAYIKICTYKELELPSSTGSDISLILNVWFKCQFNLVFLIMWRCEAPAQNTFLFAKVTSYYCPEYFWAMSVVIAHTCSTFC